MLLTRLRKIFVVHIYPTMSLEDGLPQGIQGPSEINKWFETFPIVLWFAQAGIVGLNDGGI